MKKKNKIKRITRETSMRGRAPQRQKQINRSQAEREKVDL